ncbi:MAG: hypothetical protein IRZ21_10430 [Thermoleophilaceae bacterium]|nr:hypothetical protein [Thermoleophilaceae bacterium]
MPEPERRSRKRRQPHAPAAAANGTVHVSRSERRNAEARARLEPLREGERPTAVTVAALIALALAVTEIVSWLAGVEIDGRRPPVSAVGPYAAVLLAAAYGMWRARYWAVLGMQALLALLILMFAVLAIYASNVAAVLVCVAVVGGAAVLFWFLVKAMARIQMSDRR